MPSMTTQHPEEQYLDIMRDIMENGVLGTDEGTGVQDKSVFGRQIRFDLSKGFPLLTTKKTFWKGIKHELFWFLKGMTNIKYLVDNGVHIWDYFPYKAYADKNPDGLSREEFIEKIASDSEFAKEYGEMPRIYGELWRRWPDADDHAIDQLQWVIDELRQDKFARNTLVTSWNPANLYAMAAPGNANPFPICHNMFQVSLKGGKLSLQLYQRSADLFLGVPFNIASYALLAHVIAEVLNVPVGEYIHTFGDVHIYSNHFDQAAEQMTREPFAFPKLEIEGGIENIDDFTLDQVKLTGYKSHARLKGALTNSGGAKTRDIKSVDSEN